MAKRAPRSLPSTSQVPWGVKLADLRAIPGDENKMWGVVSVTPQMAANWLKDPDRPANRGISSSHVAVIRGWLQRGEWKVTHQGFAFDEKGKLFDGAHRCSAIVAEGVTVQVSISVGFDYATVMPALDGGKKRSLGEVLRVKGKANYTQLGTALRWIYLPLGGPGRVKSNRMPSHFVAIQVLEAYPSVEKWLAEATSHNSFRQVCPSIGQFAGLCTLMEKADPNSARDFFDGVVKGVGLFDGDPRLLLRDRYLRTKKARTGMPDKLYPYQLYAYTVVAWRGFCRGAFLSRLMGPKGDTLPEFYGLDWEEEGEALDKRLQAT